MLTIVWDVDDVLNELMKSWFEQAWLPKHPTCAVRYEALTHNPPHEILGISLEEYLQSLDSFRFSDEGKALTPVPEVVSWFRGHGNRFRHIALTATPIQCAPYSASWVMKHFGEWIRSFSFVPSPRPGDPAFKLDVTKLAYLQWLGKADMLVDDNPVTISQTQQSGIRTFLVPRPWNRASGSFSDLLQEIAGIA